MQATALSGFKENSEGFGQLFPGRTGARVRRAWLRRRAASSAVTARLRSPGAGDGARGPAVTLSARCPPWTGPRRHVARSPFRAGGHVPAPVGASQGLRQPGAGLARGRPSPALSLSLSCSERLVDAEGPLHLYAPGARPGLAHGSSSPRFAG